MMKCLCEGEAGVHHVQGRLLTVCCILVLASSMKDPKRIVMRNHLLKVQITMALLNTLIYWDVAEGS
jgi:hypothetical protein